MYSVTAGARTDRDHRISHTFGLGTNEIVFVHEADAHRVHERIAFVRGIEDDLASDGWNSDTVAVVADPFDDAREQIPHPRAVETPEAKRVEHRDGARAHREHVPENSSHACRGALVGLDGRRMIVRLDLECDGETITDGDYTRILARTLQHVVRFRWQSFQQRTRVLV